MRADLIVLGALTFLGTSLGLLHIALAIRAFRRSFLTGLASLFVPLAAPFLTVRTGARKAAIAYAVLAVGYFSLLAFASR